MTAPVVDLFIARLEAQKAQVRRVTSTGVAVAVAEACAERAVRRLGVPPGLPEEWRPSGVELVEDHGLAPDELDAVDGALTGCTLAIADTGTLVLAAGAADGRRALSLVPDVYVCVVREDQIVPDLPAAMPRISGLIREDGRPVVFVSGPSATSDIELQRVEGVHGPRQLVVVLVS